MKVTEFFLGFGPRLLSFSRGETEYGIKAIPAGAYVRIIGMNNLEEVEPEDEGRTYREKGYWQRFGVVLAGSAMHFLHGAHPASSHARASPARPVGTLQADHVERRLVGPEGLRLGRGQGRRHARGRPRGGHRRPAGHVVRRHRDGAPGPRRRDHPHDRGRRDGTASCTPPSAGARRSRTGRPHAGRRLLGVTVHAGRRQPVERVGVPEARPADVQRRYTSPHRPPVACGRGAERLSRRAQPPAQLQPPGRPTRQRRTSQSSAARSATSLTPGLSLHPVRPTTVPTATAGHARSAPVEGVARVAAGTSGQPAAATPPRRPATG